MKKKLLSAFLSLVLCVSMVPATSFADQAQAEDAGQSYENPEGTEAEAQVAAQQSEAGDNQGSASQGRAASATRSLSGDSEQKDSSVVKLTHGSEVAYYDTWKEADAAASNGDTLTLLKDVSEGLQLRKELTIDLNGHNLTGATYVTSNSSITLVDSCGGGSVSSLKVHSTPESCSLTVPAGNDDLEIKKLVVGRFTSIALSSGKYESIEKDSVMGSSMNELHDLLANGYTFAQADSSDDLIKVYGTGSASNVKVVSHSTHVYTSATSERVEPGQCYCGYWCQHECGPYGDGGCAECYLPLMASVTDDAGHASYYTEFDAAVSAALEKGVNKITALHHLQQFSGPEPISLENLEVANFTLEFEWIADLPKTTVTVDSLGTSVVITGGGGCGKVLVKNCAGITFSNARIDQLDVSDSSIVQGMKFWGEINEKISLPEGCKVKDLLPDSGYGCKNLADGVADPWNSINLDTNVIEGNFAIKPIPITSMSITPDKTQIEVGGTVTLEANVSLVDDDYSVDEYKWYEAKGQEEEYLTTTNSNTLNTGSSLAVGSHTIRCKASRDGYVKSADCVVDVTKKSYMEGDDFTAPTGVSDLTYTGKEQSLVTAPTKVPNGACVQYHVGENDWQDEIPTAKDAGNYSVYWRIVGNDQYSDYYEDSPIAVSIGQAEAGNPETGSLEITQYVAGAYTFDVAQLLPELSAEGASYGDIQYSVTNVDLLNGYYDESKAPAQIDDTGALSLPIQENKNTGTGEVGKVAVEAKTKNYGTIKLQIKVSVRELSLDFELTGPCGQENTETFDVGAKLPNDAQITSVEMKDPTSILSSITPTFVMGKKSCTIEVTSRIFDEPQSAALPIAVETENYGIIAGTIKVTLTGKYIVNIAACPQDALYDGNSHSGYSGTVSATLKTSGEPYTGNDLTYTYAKVDGSVLEGAPSEPGDYTLTIAVPDSNETYKGSTKIQFAIVSEAEALYQTEEDGEWQGGTFDEALLDVYDGGTVKLLKNVGRVRYADLVRPVTITSNDPSAPCKIYAKSDQHGYLLNVDTGASAQRDVSGGVMLENVVVDGGSQDGLTAKRAAIAVSSGHLTLGAGAVVQNNTNALWENGHQSGIGGGICVNGGALTLGAGSVVRNNRVDNGQTDSTADGVGGGIGIYKGTLVIDGGCITGNEAVRGGGVYLQNNGSIELKSGSLEGNASRKNGAAVYVNTGNAENTFVMTGGTISGNTASGNGGGVFVKDGTFVMKGGVITSNTAQYGGGAFVNNNAPNYHAIFKLSGGSISNNTALGYGGGIICAPGGEIRLSGSPFITSNTSGEEECGGIYLNGDGGANADADVIIEGALTEQARVSFFAWKQKNEFVVAMPEDGYIITSADKGQLHYAGQSFGLKLNDAGNVVLYQADFTVEAKAYGGGSISPSGKMGVFRGDSVKFTIAPDEGFVVKDVTVDGQSVMNDVADDGQNGVAVKTYVLKDIQSGHEVNAFFEEVPSGGDEGGDGGGGAEGGNGGSDDSTTPPDGSSGSDQQTPTALNKDAASDESARGVAKAGDSSGIVMAAVAGVAVVAAGAVLMAVRRVRKRDDA